MHQLKKTGALVLLAVLASIYSNLFAANWLMLQGTENKKSAKHRFWGFIQPAYTYDTSDDLSGLTGAFAVNNGTRTAKNSVAPWYKDADKLHIRRARFGVRGKLKPKINYFTLFEIAPNLLTYDPFGDRARGIALDHMSVTFNHFKGARIRAGLFKTPGPEESYKAIHTQNYIEFTDFIAREQLERFVTGAAKPPASVNSPGLGTPSNTAYGTNGVRDWGIQVFDRIKGKQWDLSYAVMLGRGEGIHESSDRDDNQDLYLYFSAEHDLPGGRGPFKNGVKIYSWYQGGKRQFETDNSGQEYDRKRYGAGFTALGKLFGSKYKHRLNAELLFADGMLFLSPTGGVAQGNLNNGNLIYAAEEGNKSRGITLDYGFYLDRKWSFDVRYHKHELLYQRASNIDPGNERIFDEWTFGVNYQINRKTRLTFNYMARDIEAPTAYGNATLTDNVRTIVDSTEDRLGLQLTYIF